MGSTGESREMANLNELAEKIRSARSILLTTHAGPDGDGIGSVVGLGRALEEQGHRVTRVLPEPVPERYRFLTPSGGILSLAEAQATLDGTVWDLALVLDTHQWEMLGALAPWLRSRRVPVVFLDHHPQSTPGREDVFGSAEAAATGELVYGLLHDYLRWPISRDAAEPIYVAISFDTNSFKYIRSNPASLLIAAELVRRGVDTNRVYRHLFASNSRGKARLTGLVLSSVQFDCGDRLAFVQIPYRTVQELAVARDDLRDSITHILEIQGVEIAATLKEMEPGKVQISLRSKGNCSVNDVAVMMGGGGHALAAGCDFTGTIEGAWARLRPPLAAALARCSAPDSTGDRAQS